jgi:hypothetical protein
MLRGRLERKSILDCFCNSAKYQKKAVLSKLFSSKLKFC